MGRGSDKQRKLAEQQIQRANQWVDQQRQQQTEARAKIEPEAQKLISSEGYSPEERNAITNQTQGAIGSVFGAASDRLSRRSARTGSSAGVAEGEARLAMDRSRAQGDAAQRAELEFAQQKRREQEQGRALLANLYGIDTSLLASTSGQPIAALGQHAQGIGSNWLDDILKGGATVASSYFAGR